MRSTQLKLVAETPAHTFGVCTDPTRIVFEHWLFMTGRNPRRCKLGPVRRAAVNAALALYDLETVLLAIDGMADDALDGKPESMRAAMRELEWFLGTEARLEHWAELGDALHARAERQAQQGERQAREPAAQSDPAAVAAARERLRQMAAAGRGEVVRRG